MWRRIVGGNESHRIDRLTLLVQSMAQEVHEEITDDIKKLSNNSIMDKLRLAHEHLVFKWTSVDPKIKCSEIVASSNVEKVTPGVVAMVTEQLRNTIQYMDWVEAGKLWMPPEKIGLRPER